VKKKRADTETRRLSHHPDFIEIVNKSWAGYKATGGTTIEEIRSKYGLKRKRRRRNDGLVKLLLACPVKGWFTPIERSETTTRVRTKRRAP
jgi:hypothetical protein